MSTLESCTQATRAVRAGIATDVAHGAVVPPLHLSSTFAFEGFAKPRTFDYTRSGNPTRAHLADAVADLERGARGVVTPGGYLTQRKAAHNLRAFPVNPIESIALLNRDGGI